MCRKCAFVARAVDVRLGQLPLDPLRQVAGQRRAPLRSDLVARRALAAALADAEAACRQLDETVARICKQHDPGGCLPVVLALAMAAIVAAITARSVRWYFVVSMSLAGMIGTWFALSLFRIVSWSRRHPLLTRMDQLRQSRKRVAEVDEDRLELGKAIVREYLPEGESRPLLARLDDATERTAALLGFDDAGRPY